MDSPTRGTQRVAPSGWPRASKAALESAKAATAAVTFTISISTFEPPYRSFHHRSTQ